MAALSAARFKSLAKMRNFSLRHLKSSASFSASASSCLRPASVRSESVQPPVKCWVWCVASPCLTRIIIIVPSSKFIICWRCTLAFFTWSSKLFLASAALFSASNISLRALASASLTVFSACMRALPRVSTASSLALSIIFLQDSSDFTFNFATSTSAAIRILLTNCCVSALSLFISASVSLRSLSASALASLRTFSA